MKASTVFGILCVTLILEMFIEHLQLNRREPLVVYTNEDIYYIDVKNLEASSEINDECITFDNFEELRFWLQTETSMDVHGPCVEYGSL